MSERVAPVAAEIVDFEAEDSASGITDYPQLDAPDRASDRIWLGRVLGESVAEHPIVVSTGTHFGSREQKRSIEAALSAPDLVGRLNGRYAVLGCDLVWRRSDVSSARHSSRVYVVNYSNNVLLEISVEDGQFQSIVERGVHEYPETAAEIAQAITMARAADELRDNVGELSAHAILRVPSDSERKDNGHRCLWVMFTERDDPSCELPVLYQALVDLTDLVVVGAGPSAGQESVPGTARTERSRRSGRS
jgi:hypothetical protein